MKQNVQKEKVNTNESASPKKKLLAEIPCMSLGEKSETDM